MNADVVDTLMQRHMKQRFQSLGSKNDISLSCVHRSDYFEEDEHHWNYQAAIRATEETWGANPILARDGGR